MFTEQQMKLHAEARAAKDNLHEHRKKAAAVREELRAVRKSGHIMLKSAAKKVDEANREYNEAHRVVVDTERSILKDCDNALAEDDRLLRLADEAEERWFNSLGPTKPEPVVGVNSILGSDPKMSED